MTSACRRIRPRTIAGGRLAPWLAAFEAEFFAFPDAAYDDQVDAVSQYFTWLRDRSQKPEPKVSWV